MKQLLTATAAIALTAGTAFADDVKIGVLLGFTGPLESVALPIAAGAELAMSEVTASGAFLGGQTATPVRGDSTCVDASAATTAGERLVTAEGVKGIMGAMCSGATGAVLANVAIPNGMVMISPSATSPGLTTVEDNGLFFRTAPSDARQGVVMAEILMERGVTEVAVSYTNNDYGKGLADSFGAAYAEAGGTVTLSAPHDDGRGDYSAEIGALSSAGGEALVVAGYVDDGGSGIIRSALDTGAFDLFVLPDGMVASKLEENFGSEIDGSFGQLAGTDSDGGAQFEAIAADAGLDGTAVYAKEGYDAAALIMLAMQAAGSTEPGDYAAKITEVANGPGEPVLAGELAKGLEILANGGEIDYVGASDVELIGPGEASGSFREVIIEGGEITTVGFR
ncbi:MAG: ABC transporter substrate-binding protein [Pseudomonadota bacterium]